MNNQVPKITTGIDEEYQKRAVEVHNKILAAYQQMVDNISETHFQPIKDVIRGSTEQKIDLEKASKLFKSNLFEKIKKEFDICWAECALEQQLIELEKSKDIAADADKKWRPTNVDVEALLRSRVARVLITKKKYLTMQVEHQTQVIGELLGEVEERRDGIQAHVEKRQQLLAAINKDLEKANIVEQQVVDMNASKFQMM